MEAIYNVCIIHTYECFHDTWTIINTKIYSKNIRTKKSLINLNNILRYQIFILSKLINDTAYALISTKRETGYLL